MSDSLLIPPEFYFQPSFEIPFQEGLEETILSGEIPMISVSLPSLSFESANSKPFGTVRIAWNDDGIALCVEITDCEPKEKGKSKAKSRIAQRPYIEFFIDTRDIKTNKRANRFCHRFTVSLPYLQEKKQIGPELIQMDMLRSQSRAQRGTQEEAPVAGSILDKKSQASCWLGQGILTGFDPENVPSIGFFYKIFDPRFGEQLYGLGENFPYTTDPSLWSSLKLTRSKTHA